MQKGSKKKPIRKPQQQNRPGQEFKMSPVPESNPDPGWKKLESKKVLITGGDSGIGRAVAVLFAKHGADIAISFLNEKKDAEDTATMVNKYDSDCILLPGDISKEKHCKSVVEKTIKKFGAIDILINNAAIHYENKEFTDISTEQLIKTFSTNIFSYFWITRYALPHMKPGSAIVNSTSVTAYRGSPSLIDYASTKGAIVSFTRSLSSNLVDKGIRVNAVAPGPIWTPLIAASFKPSKVAAHGSDAPMKRAGEPAEVAPSYLFLASDDSSYITGQVLHPNGGEIING
ncbi:SDR family oxidoreductase [Pollutibacter soli]|uniref:SDR family oxidoreductase n=1 Tax=Pollutibacter soli TaxID=3034157 RepID=UPI0030139941